MEERLQQLAKEFQDAAQRYCDDTGRTFEAYFHFIDATCLSSEKIDILVNVDVESAFSAKA